VTAAALLYMGYPVVIHGSSTNTLRTSPSSRYGNLRNRIMANRILSRLFLADFVTPSGTDKATAM
jgi:hypothetical protein